MERYIGLDVHAASTTFAIIAADGRKLRSQVVETNGKALIDFLKTIPGKRHVCLEEGTQSAWLYEILSPHAEEVVVVGIADSRGQKDDERDAFGLANRLRIGAIERRVFKDASGKLTLLRELSRAHSMVVRDVVRVQNRIRSLYRSRGISVTKSVYSEKGREPLLARLPKATRQAAETLYAQYDALKPIRANAEKQLVAEAHKHPISRVLETAPGLGPIRVAQMMPVVISPGRFRTKRQFWSYCGLGIVMRSSSDWVPKKGGGWDWAAVQQTRGLNLNHNHTLKHVFKGAATTVIAQLETEPLHQHYQRLLASGTKPNLAKLTVARKIAAITLALWKSGKEYDATKHRKKT